MNDAQIKQALTEIDRLERKARAMKWDLASKAYNAAQICTEAKISLPTLYLWVALKN